MPTPLICETYDETTGEMEQSREVDHDNPNDRKWMGRHSFWAARNGKRFTTYPFPEASVSDE